MPSALDKNKTYSDKNLGYRIDDKGIAYDLKTGQSLSRQDVDARIAAAEKATGIDYDERQRHRGGVAGFYDHNKKWVVPALEFGAAMLPGVGPLASAAIGALTGFDREGQGGIGYDVKKGALGAASGYGLGKMGDATGSWLGNALGKGGEAAAASGAGDIANAGKVFGSTPIPDVESAQFAGFPGTPAMQASSMGGSLGNQLAAPSGGASVPRLGSFQGFTPPSVNTIASSGAQLPPAPQSWAGRLGASIEKNPTAYGMGLQGLGKLASLPSENKMAGAQSRLADAQASSLEYQNQRRQQNDQALSSLRAQLAAQISRIMQGNTPRTA